MEVRATASIFTVPYRQNIYKVVTVILIMVFKNKYLILEFIFLIILLVLTFIKGFDSSRAVDLIDFGWFR